MLFEWMSDPAAWVGLATLILLEIVLGIDNLVFIAVLADKLPPHQRDRARIIGLSLALAMRLALLASISWIVTLTQPVLTLFDKGFSWRDIILIVGGLFLLFKGTMELHERLEGHSAKKSGPQVHAVFWQVIAQIVVLDAIFSLDSVITAVGMVQHLSVMVIAVIVAVGVMMLSAKPLMNFVSKHPTVVILCLGFLMMIGFSLITEGFGFHVPKGYLYAAIGFSVLIEALNQIGRANRERVITAGDLRERTASAVLRLLGGGDREAEALPGEAGALASRVAQSGIFDRGETEMIQGVLTLAERTATSVMTPRTEIDWLDLDKPLDDLHRQIIEEGHSRYLLARGSLENFVGMALTRDLLRDLLEEGKINLERSLRKPLVVHETITALRLMEGLRRSPVQMAVVVDEFGSIEGIVTPTDLLESIAGEFIEEDQDRHAIHEDEDGSWEVDGSLDIHRASSLVGTRLVDDENRYSTIAGYILWRLLRLAQVGDKVTAGDLEFEVMAMDGRAIDRVRIRRLPPPE